jgi:hypothetical protein
MVSEPERRVVKEKVPELSSDEVLRAHFSTASNSKKPKKSLNPGIKQSSNKNQNVDKTQNHN